MSFQKMYENGKNWIAFGNVLFQSCLTATSPFQLSAFQSGPSKSFLTTRSLQVVPYNSFLTNRSSNSFVVDSKNESIFFAHRGRQQHIAPQSPSFRPEWVWAVRRESQCWSSSPSTHFTHSGAAKGHWRPSQNGHSRGAGSTRPNQQILAKHSRWSQSNARWTRSNGHDHGRYD